MKTSTRTFAILALWVVLVGGAGVGAAATTSASSGSGDGDTGAASAHGQHGGPGPLSMLQVQHGVRSAWCPAPGTEIAFAPGEPEVEATLRLTSAAYGPDELVLPPQVNVRLRVENDDDVAHQAAVYHPSRAGCPLALVDVPAGEAGVLELRLAEGAYVLGDRTHEREAVRLLVG